MDVKTIRIIKASSPDREGLLAERIKELEAFGFKILFNDITPNTEWIWTAGRVLDRSKELNQALLEDDSDAVMWARGGYGASDLIDLIPWEKVLRAKAKPIVGFSDVCAAQSALFTLTGRSSIHGPMPATTTWRKTGSNDIEDLVAVLKGIKTSGTLNACPIDNSPDGVEGLLFGGCLSVLSSLIGTPYLPKSFGGYILYFEDIGENPGLVMRMLTQWKQAGLLFGVRGIIMGTFTDKDGKIPDYSAILQREVFTRFKIPTYASADFGHISPNIPIVMGSMGTIRNGKLTWTLGSQVT